MTTPQNSAEEIHMALLDPTSWLFKKMSADEQFQQELKLMDIIEICQMRSDMLSREKALEAAEIDRAERQQQYDEHERLQQSAQEQRELESKMLTSAQLDQDALKQKIKQLEESRERILHEMGSIGKSVEALCNYHQGEMQVVANRLAAAPLVNAQGAPISNQTREAMQQTILAGPPLPLALARVLKYNPVLQAQYMGAATHERPHFANRFLLGINMGKELDVLNLLSQDGLSSIKESIRELPKLAKANRAALKVFEEIGHKVGQINNGLTNTVVSFCDAFVEKTEEMRNLPDKVTEFLVTDNLLSYAKSLLKPVPTLRR